MTEPAVTESVDGFVALDHAADGELLLDPGAAGAAVDLAQAGDGADRLGLGLDEKAGAAVGDDLGHGALWIGDDRCADRQGLGDGEAEGLLPLEGEEEALGTAHQLQHLVVGEVGDVADAVAVDVGLDLLAVIALGPGKLGRGVADDDEALAGGLGDTDGVGDALVGGDAPHDDEEVLALGAEGGGVDVDAVGDDGEIGLAEVLGLPAADADGVDVGEVGAVVVVQRLFDVGVSEDRRRGGEGGEVGGQGGPVAVDDVEVAAAAVEVEGVAGLHLLVDVGGAVVVVGGGDVDDCVELGADVGVAGGEEVDVVAAGDEPFDEVVDHELGAPVASGRHREVGAGDLGDAHGGAPEVRPAPRLRGRRPGRARCSR